MSIRKHLIKLAKRIENSWQTIDLSSGVEGKGVAIRSGWYVTEFTIQGAIKHIPEILVIDESAKEVKRSLIGFHSGRNRMLFFLPAGHIVAYDKELQFDFLSRVTELEGRARVFLITFRYLIDFFSIKLLFKIIAMQFQSRFELSTDILQFYFPKNYLYEIQRWNRLKGFSWLLNWMTSGINIAVLIEDESQRVFLDEQLVLADQVLLATQSDDLADDIDYVILLAKTERLRAPAIAMLKHAVKGHKRKYKSAPKLIYTDHDYSLSNVVDIDQAVMEPVLKPQASLAYLYCFDYVGPAVIFAKESLTEQESLTDEVLATGRDDAVRYYACLELFQNTENVLHIPEALFVSERQKSTLTPAPITSESAWVNIDWQRRNDFNALVASAEWQNKPSVDLIIPTRDRLDVLKPCIESILEKTDYPLFSIFIVDNNSEEIATKEYLAEIALKNNIQVIDFPGEFNYSAINNLAISKGKSDYVALINNDIEVIHADWLTQMMAWAEQPNVGIVGAKLLYGNDNIQHAGVTIGMGNAAGHIHRLADGQSLGYQHRLVATQNMMAVTAACFITPRKLFNEIGGLDEEIFKVAYNDIDYCLKVESKGLDIIWTPEARLFHH